MTGPTFDPMAYRLVCERCGKDGPLVGRIPRKVAAAGGKPCACGGVVFGIREAPAAVIAALVEAE